MTSKEEQNLPVKKSRKEREQERKRNEILDAAERLFFSKGYEETSINEIAAEAEFAKGTLYLYFSGKSEIYLAIVNRSLDLIHEMIQEKNSPAKTGAQKLQLGCDVFADFFDKHSDYFNMWLQASLYVSPEIYTNHPVGQECQTKERQLMEMNINSLAEGIQDGSIKGTSNPVLGALAVTVFNRGLYQFLLDDKERLLGLMNISRKELVDFMRTLLNRGLEITPEEK